MLKAALREYNLNGFALEGKNNQYGKSSFIRPAGGYDNIAAVASDLLPRLMGDPLLGRFWQNRGEDSVRREKQLLIDFLCANSGGPMLYVGRDMPTTHKGMGITQNDWENFRKHLDATLDHFQIPEKEKSEVAGFVESSKGDIVEK